MHVIEKANNPLLNALDVEDRRDLVFDVLVVVGSAVVLLAIVAAGMLIWMLPPKN